LLRGRHSTLARETAGRKVYHRQGGKTRAQRRLESLAAQTALREQIRECDPDTIDRAALIFGRDNHNARQAFSRIVDEARTGVQPSSGVTRIERARSAIITALREPPPPAPPKPPPQDKPVYFTLTAEEGVEFERMGSTIAKASFLTAMHTAKERSAWLAKIAQARLGTRRKVRVNVTKENGAWIARRI
jgi:hypothetical protein